MPVILVKAIDFQIMNRCYSWKLQFLHVIYMCNETAENGVLLKEYCCVHASQVYDGKPSDSNKTISCKLNESVYCFFSYVNSMTSCVLTIILYCKYFVTIFLFFFAFILFLFLFCFVFFLVLLCML